MNLHPIEWIGAYADGQLQGERLRRVEQHIETCPTCQVELEQHQKLSTLLSEWPALPVQKPSDVYAKQVHRRLPAQPAAPPWQKALRTGWLLAPLAVVAFWAYGQSVTLVSNLILLALNTDASGQVGLTTLALFGLLPATYSLLGPLNSLLSEQAGEISSWMAVLESLASGLSLSLAVTIITASLLAGWLGSYWAYRKRALEQVAEFEWENPR